ncbi:TonB-dependent receptor [Sphingopyxis terrae]|uniref:TonB-dependent receptor n=1 Tax=Sphingopyxis terrae TaxID=33052 RepID=UPI002A14999E|nr:TonB-dependent receptor [Sphingopyxis terrae]MDX8358542.1 TonB-dependent receptor [Sphingopyxis terrae]
MLPLLFAAIASNPVAEPVPADERPIMLYDPGFEEIVVTGGGELAPSEGDLVVASSLYLGVPSGAGSRVENDVRDRGGVAQFRRSDGRSAHPTSQGVTLRGLGGTASSRAVVTLDGIPQADPFGGWVAWTSFDTVNLRGFRIIPGASVDEQGALAGHIALSSDIGEGVTSSVSYGSFNSIDMTGGLGAELTGGELALDARYMRSDGFTPVLAGQRGNADRPAAYRQGGGGLRARLDAGSDGKVEVSVRGFFDRRDRGTDFSASRIDGVDASIRYILDPTPNKGWQAIALAYIQLRDFQSGFASVSTDRNSVAPALNQRVPATGLGARLELRPPLRGNNPLRIGLDWRRTEGETREDFFFTGLVPGRNRVAGGSANIVGGFAEWTSGEKLSWTIGARVDHWRLGAGQLIERNADGSLRTNEHFAVRSGWETGARAGVRWRSGGFDLRAAAYSGWRLPTLNELYRPFRVGADATAANANLDPERLRGGELSFRYDNFPRLTLFVSRLDNAIANVTLGQGPGTFPGVGFVAAGASYAQRQNLDALVSKGIEISQTMTIAKGLDIDLHYTFVDAHVRASGVAAALDGRRPAQVARHNGYAGLRYRNGDATLTTRLRYIGAQNEDDLGRQRLGDAFTVDTGLSVDLGKKLSAFVQADNIFDALVPAAISASGIVERAQPRSIWVGVGLAL